MSASLVAVSGSYSGSPSEMVAGEGVRLGMVTVLVCGAVAKRVELGSSRLRDALE